MNAVIAQLRSTGVTKLFATGYCFGGPICCHCTKRSLTLLLGLYVTLLAQNNSVEAVSMSHPSALQIPEDFEKVLNTSRVPIQINNAERDNALTPALASQVDGVLGDGRYRPGYSRQQFAGVGHGFAVTAQAVSV
jgi:dienelactone hydrolase